jgi:hypothetical protein
VSLNPYPSPQVEKGIAKIREGGEEPIHKSQPLPFSIPSEAKVKRIAKMRAKRVEVAVHKSILPLIFFRYQY